MRLTNDEVIKNGEQELIDSINGELDWEVLEEIFKREHKLNIGEDIEFKRGDIEIFSGQIAYRLDFEIKVPLSLLLDREGNYLSCKTVDEGFQKEDASETTKDQGKAAEVLNALPPVDDNLNCIPKEIDLNDNEESAQAKTDNVPAEKPMDKISQVAALAGNVLDELKQKSV